MKIFFGNIIMRQASEHQRVVILLLREFVLKSHNFEALSTEMASVNGAFSAHVEHLFMGMGIIFNSWTHTYDNSPR
jgi:hypothetical protein